MQLDAKEDASKFFNLCDASFPLHVKCPGRNYTLTSWSDVSEMLLNPIAGLSLIEHARTLSVKVGPKNWKTISLESLSYVQEVAWFLLDYSRATSNYIHGYLFPGQLEDQPHIYYGIGQAFDVINSAKSECELDNLRVAKQKAKQNGEH